MNLMESNCDLCGHPKSTFQTIKFADIFTHLHAHEGQEECQCGDQQQQQQHLNNGQQQGHHHGGNGKDNVNVKVDAETCGVPVIQHHSHGGGHHNNHIQYFTSTSSVGSHQINHQQQHSNAFMPSFHDVQQQRLFISNQEFDTHPLQQQQQQQPNYIIPSTTTTPLFPHGHPDPRPAIIDTKVPISVMIQHNPTSTQSGGGVGVITKNKKEVVSSPLQSNPKPTPTTPRVPCSLCKKTFVNEKMATAHLQRVHEKKSRFVCEICGVAFSYRGSLDSHLCSHTTTPTVTFDCPTCGQKFKQKSNLSQHMKYHSENVKKFLCPHCPSGFSKRVNLRYHIRRKHPGAEGSEDASSSVFPTTATTPMPSDATTTPSIIDIPQDQPLTISSSKKKKDKPQGQGNFKCDECGRSFLFKNNLKAHLRTHSKEKKYTCAECEKSFIYKESLKNHMLLHSNELPYNCDICGKKFRDRSNRRKHVKNVHKYLFLNNNNNGESGGVGCETSTLSSATSVVREPDKPPAKRTTKKIPKPIAQVVQPVSNVIKKARKRVKKVAAATSIPEMPPTTSTTSVIVSNNNTGMELDRKIIMSPGPRPSTSLSSDYPPLQPPGTNVIVKTPSVQMQNVIVYPNKSRPDVISNGGGNFQHFSTSDLNNQMEMQASSTSVPSGSGRGGFQHFTLSRGIITASSAVTNNVHYNYEPQLQQTQYETWSEQASGSPSTAISQQEPFVEQSSQYATPSSNIVYSNSLSTAIQHGGSSNNQLINQQQNSGSGSVMDPSVEHLDLLAQNGSAFFYKDLSQFDFSYL